MDALSLFPTPFLHTNVQNELNISEVERLLALEQDSVNLVKNVNGNFFHNDTYVLRQRLSGSALGLLMDRYVNIFVTEIWGETESKIKITNSWVNFNPPGSSHHVHSHANSVISGVLYLRTNENCGNLVIHSPSYRERQIQGAPIKKTKYNLGTVEFSPKQYDLVIFPSTLQHSVQRNVSQETRASLSFNSFYEGFVSTRAKSYHSLAQLTIKDIE